MAPPGPGPIAVGSTRYFGIAGRTGGDRWDTSAGLQQTGSPAGGSWTDVPAATSPYVIPASGARQFFRLVR